ncbi:MAG TPA: PrsW family intramembrane metalloprotease [Labilithrix sp.]
MKAARAIALALLAAFALWCAAHAWTRHLVGTNDVALDYEQRGPEVRGEGAADSPKGRSNEDPILPLRMELRLLVSRVPAEIHPMAGGVRVVVDRDREASAEHALAWSGGLSIWSLDDSEPMPAAEAAGLVLGEKNTYTGSYDAMLHAAEKTADGPRHLLYDPFQARVRIARHLLDLSGTFARSDGKSIVVGIRDDEEVRRAVELLKDHGKETVAFARGPRIVWIAPLEHGLAAKGAAGVAIVPRGTDLVAYKRARDDARVIGTRLPTLERVGRRELPADYTLAIACVLLPLTAGLSWLVFLRRFDRAQPEPRWLVLATFALGALAGPVAGKIEAWLSDLSPWLDPEVMVLDRSAIVFPVGLVVYAISVGVVEEGTKFLAVWALAMRRRELDEPIDGIVYAGAAAIGFAVEENVGYLSAFRLGDSLVVGRSLSCVADHLMFSAIWGYALGKRLVDKRARVLPWFAIAALLHGLEDNMLAFGVPYAGMIATGVATVIFVVLLRKALRWGAATAIGDAAPASSRRTLFALGSPPIAIGCASAMVLVVAAMKALARSADQDHVRVTVAMLGGSAALLVALGFFAWRATLAMPLDAVLDDLGVTFAGALRKWSDISGATRASAGWLVVHARSGDLRIGPGKKLAIDSVEAALRARVPREEAREA